MKKLLFVFCASALIMASCGQGQADAEKARQDSIADSLRRTDSIRVADSLVIVESKKIRSQDMNYFMLHGRVKSITMDEVIYLFDKTGKLVKISDKNFCFYHQGKDLWINKKYGDSWDYEFQKLSIDSEGKFKQFCSEVMEFRFTYNFSNYNSDGWPTIIDKIEEIETCGATISKDTLIYSKIDKMGNWTECGDIKRKIEYYTEEEYNKK